MKAIECTKYGTSEVLCLNEVAKPSVGNKSFLDCKKSLPIHGIYLSSVLNFFLLIQMFWASLFGHKKVKFSATGMLPVKERLNYLIELKELLE